MSRHNRTWRETEVEHFRNHPDEIPLYLDIALEDAEKDGTWGAFMESLRVVAEAQGGLGELAKRLECNRAHLYKALSEKGNPRLETLGAILHELGLRLSVQPLGQTTASR